MTRSLLDPAAAAVGPGYYVVTPDEVRPVQACPPGRLADGLRCLIEQEVSGLPEERIPERLRGLLDAFGFEWERLSEPGHMRLIGHAAFMLDQARRNAAGTVEAICHSLGIGYLPVDGVVLVDPTAGRMPDYLKMTGGEVSLYGEAPYDVRCAGQRYMLRQTSCLQKYSACLDHRLAAGSLPTCLFEISDSFRQERPEALQLSYRLRRFHLPEAHIHSLSLRDSVELSLRLHRHVLTALSELEADLILLISASHDFAASHTGYLRQLVEMGGTALLKVSAPGQMCQDGVEVDVEYKVVDSAGCCRELSTFQIDHQITGTFGVRCDDGTTPTTIHAVCTGSVERFLFCTLDRVVRFQNAGLRRHLPLWISPVVARVVPRCPQALPAARHAAGVLGAAGVRTELDDRDVSLDRAIRDADSLLVPYLVLADAAVADVAAGGLVSVRDYESGRFEQADIRKLAAQVATASAVPRGRELGLLPPLSRQPFSVR